jgi:hypothetical protein
MSTDITRGPKLCPSCGKENPPTAARCALCSTPLGGAIQTTPTPAWGEIRASPDPDARLSGPPPFGGMLRVAGAALVAFCVFGSAVITFLLVCTGTAVANLGGSPLVGWLCIVLAGLAAALVGSVVYILLRHRPQR